MTNKRGLIVDDSKTAQFKLKKMLEEYDITLDTVFSAEDALSYLAYQTPDIIFMDHSMKGMNGLEAVKVIKLNPTTAIIPVVMYTAEKGDVYMGQARAVGAIDVVSKDTMSASDIQHVMNSVGISSQATVESTQKLPNPSNDKLADSTNIDPQSYLIHMRNQVSRAMDIQHAKIQRDIQDNSRLVTRRLMHEVSELQSSLKKLGNQLTSPPIIKDPPLPQETTKPRSLLWYILPMLFLVFAVIYVATELDDLKDENRALINANKLFSVALAEQNKKILAHVRTIINQNRNTQTQQYQTLWEGLTRAINQNKGYAYSATPLDAERTNAIKNLVDLLDETNYKGVVDIQIHSGNFCLVTNKQGQLVLPDNDSHVGDCQRQDYYNLDPSRVEQLSYEFDDYVSSDPIFDKGNIKIVVNVINRYSTLVDYPNIGITTTAGEWNKSARSNNQVLIDLEPSNN